MKDSKPKTALKSWLDLFRSNANEQRIDTLTAFVRDSEHEMMSVLTALQAQIDLLHDELATQKMPRDRFAGLNRSVSRLVADTYAISSIAKLATAKPMKNKSLLEVLMKEVIAEAHAEINNDRITVACTIAAGATLLGDPVSLKQVCKEMLFVVLQKCQALDKVTIVGLAQKKLVSLSFDIGTIAESDKFVTWRSGQLHHVPTNGDGIRLATIDAMARMHQGQLDICRLPEARDAYRLVLRS